MRLRGRFIVLDGVDGTGKSTQAKRLLAYLEADLGRPALHVRDPGGTSIGESIREVLLDRGSTGMSMRTEILLYMASRAQLVDEVILPALEEGTDVVCERYLLSTIIYQGIAAGEDLDAVRRIGQYSIQSVVPDLTVVLDLSVEAARERMRARDLDRIESRSAEFQLKVRAGFARAESLLPPWNVVRVSAEGGEDEVFELIRKAVDLVL